MSSRAEKIEKYHQATLKALSELKDEAELKLAFEYIEAKAASGADIDLETFISEAVGA